MYTGMLHLHVTSVILFLLIYALKNFFLLGRQYPLLEKFRKITRIPEMVISTLFLLTGIFLWTQSGNIGPWFYAKLAAVFASIPLAVIAFKKNKPVLSLLSLVLLVYAYGVAETKSATFRKERADEKLKAVPEAELGKTVFNMYCTPCHGEDGKLGLSGAKDLTVSPKTPEEMKLIIMNGKNVMSGYKNILDEKQIEAVTAYVAGMKTQQ